MEGSDDSVKVAVNIRPLITSELLNGCTYCVTVTPGEPQVQIGSHVFTYDHVYGLPGAPQSCRIFEECVMPLVDALFRGYNATVLAYGQTGSGKTHTMGTNYLGETNASGIIPKVVEEIFEKVKKLRDKTEFLIRVTFIEIFKEEVFDLLDPQTHTAKSGPYRVPIKIRETALGGIILAGVSEPAVKSKEEMASFLARGSLNRATASTHMNIQSSRSHAIFTICIEQKRTASSFQSDAVDDILISKLHLVDLAGSERAKRTGADGLRLKEGIHINKGLLSLGNVINALGDEKKRKECAFVPYRDSKLTRVLQDSLGGNSKTIMIACISPADSNANETINTLKYANRSRNIKNKAIINRDPVAAEMQRLRSQLEQMQGELHFARSGSALLKEIQILQEKISLLELQNGELRHKLKEADRKCCDFSLKATKAQLEKEAESREKDMLISELKAKVEHLTINVRQSGELQVENMHLNGVSGLSNTMEKSGDIEANHGEESENDMEIPDVDSEDSDFVACDLVDEKSDMVTTINKTHKKNREVTVVLSEIPLEGADETTHGKCCACTKLSFCKTKKCECRLAGAECGSLCGCSASKCANRGFSKSKKEESCSFSDKAGEDKENFTMVLQSTLLLESAMESGLEAKSKLKKSKSRKPSDDIGNVKQKCAEFFEEQGGVRNSMKQVRERRPKLGWTKKEIEALKEGILEQLASQNHRARKKISWMNILKKYKDVFHPKRESKDLKNKFAIDKIFEQIRKNNVFRHPWSPEEIKVLEEAAKEHLEKYKRICWIKILEKYRHIFHEERKPNDLYDKYSKPRRKK